MTAPDLMLVLADTPWPPVLAALAGRLGLARPPAAHALPAMAADPAMAQLQAWRAGDESAFDALVAEHQAAAFGCAWRILGDRDGAADAVQEAFVRVLRHCDSYDGRPFRSWLLGIVRNLAIDQLRARRPAGDLPDLAQRADPARPSDCAELRCQVAEVLGLLPEKYRLPLVMRELEGLPAEDIARQLSIEYGLLRWRLHEARRLFRTAWLARHGEEF